MSATGMGNGVGSSGEAPAPGAGQPRVLVVGQYIKDLSFENPGAPNSVVQRPGIDLGVDLQARRMDADHFEVELKLRVTAKAEEKSIFLLELVYAGLFQIQNIPDEVLQQVLLIEAPHLIFPFARRIVADAVRDGGMPPLLIEPIDFAALYRAKHAEMQQLRTSGTAGPVVT
jgi:preprotein translocase subunit SecB